MEYVPALISETGPCVERSGLLLVWNVLPFHGAYTTFDSREEYAALTRHAYANLLSRLTRTPILPSPRHDNQRMVPYLDIGLCRAP
jgi:hypothetical protein